MNMTRDEKLAEDVEQDWFFTFGQAHVHRNKFVRIRGTWATARDKMCTLYGNRWAFQYSESQLQSCILNYGCTELV